MCVIRVLFVQREPCVRTYKYAATLTAIRESGLIELALASQHPTPEFLARQFPESTFDRYFRIEGPEIDSAVDRLLLQYRPDVVHSHNLPDQLTVAATRSGWNAGIIHDVHDLGSLRSTTPDDGHAQVPEALAQEAISIGEADAIICASDRIAEIICGLYRPQADVRVIPNLPLARAMTVRPPIEVEQAVPPARPRIVYAGALKDDGGHYDLRPIFTTLLRADVDVDVFCTTNTPVSYLDLALAKPNLRLHRSVPFDELHDLLPAYTAGLAAFNDSVNAPHVDTVLPNKVFDYAAAGLPILTLPHATLASWVEEFQAGAVASDVDDLPRTLFAIHESGLRGERPAALEVPPFESCEAELIALYTSLAFDASVRVRA